MIVGVWLLRPDGIEHAAKPPSEDRGSRTEDGVAAVRGRRRASSNARLMQSDFVGCVGCAAPGTVDIPSPFTTSTEHFDDML